MKKFLFIFVTAVCLTFFLFHKINPSSSLDRYQKTEIMADEIAGLFPGIAQVDYIELAKDSYILLDVRDDAEWQVSHIPGAVRALKEEDKKQKVAVYCTIGHRSAQQTERLRAQGVEAFNLRGGILRWLHAGNLIHDSQGNPVKKVHVYGADWNTAPEGVEAVW